MKKVYLIVIVLLLFSLACSLSGIRSQPDDVPEQIDPIVPPQNIEEPEVPAVEPIVLFSDDFSSTSSGWDRDDWENGTTDYENGKYLMHVKTDQYDVWTNPYLFFEGDVIIDVDAERIGGPLLNDFGIICRYVDISNFYELLIGNDGYIEIIRLEDGEATSLYHDFTPGIFDDTFNHLTASCVGDMLTLYVNGEMIASAQDSTFSNGDVGLIAGAFDEPGVKILFDNFVVTSP